MYSCVGTVEKGRMLTERARRFSDEMANQISGPDSPSRLKDFIASHKILTAVAVFLAIGVLGNIFGSHSTKPLSAPATTTSLPTSTPTTQPIPSGPVGIGSTVAQMTAAYGVARGPGQFCSSTDACFGGPLQNDESGHTFQFTTVSIQKGLVLGYTMNFAKGTTASDAVLQLLLGLPRDATHTAIVVGHNAALNSSCGLLNITSSTIGRILTKAGETGIPGHPADELGVYLSYTNPSLNLVYDPNNVEDATVTLLSFNLNAPSC
jgi:hypothetical protein